MTVLKCKSCGAPLNTESNAQIVECIYCNLQQTIPKMDDEFKLQMFNQANDLRRQFDFDGAKAFLQAVISRHPEEAEAYWQICLCKYGIMYVEDQQTLRQIPTFYRMIPKSILSDEDYLKACKYAGASSWKYEEEAKKIEKLQKKILDLSNTEDPYDIFICYKKTDPDSGALTEDSRIASQIYMKLIENNYRVFWAERSLPPGCEYEPYIYSALATAKVMLVLSTDKRYFESPWVRNEWIRFLDMMSRDPEKTIMTCYKKISVEDIPSNLRSLQALDMDNMLFSSDLLERIERKIPKKKQDLDTETLFNAFKNFQAANNQNNTSNSPNREIPFENGVYIGDAIADKPHGQGTHFLPNGDKYEGGWNVGKKHGQGTYYHHNGETCIGEFRNGYPWNAEGLFSLPSNNYAVFKGSWVNGKPNGIGTIEFTNKNERISGRFYHGLNGEISYYFADGRRYEGDLVEGKFSGQGKLIAADNRIIYDGYYANNYMNGYGVYYINEYERYEGYFQDGKYNGQGTYYYPQGYWTGEWREGARWNGQGLLFYYDSSGRQTGKYFNGTMYNGQASGRGVLRFEDGSRFEGEFYNNNYYNGAIYNSQNQVIDTYINGESQQQKNRNLNQTIVDTAIEIFKGFSNL